MRIISQNGITDIPYDLYGVRQLSSDLSKIIAFKSSDEYLLMAEYSSIEKAENAMEMLRRAYIGMPIVAVKDMEMDVKMMADAIRNGFVQPMPLNESKIECDIFQFPKDEDVEV